jgi:MFS family permease
MYYLIDAASSLVTGWLADFWIRGGGTPNVARKSAMALGFMISAIALGCCAIAGPRTYLPCLLAVGVGSGMGNAGTFAFCQTLAGPRAAGSWVGLQNGIANLAGVFGPALTGFLLDWSGNFSMALAVAAGISVIGGLSWVLVVKHLEPVRWEPESSPSAIAVVDVA